MVKMVGSFEVKDWDHWKKSFDAHKEPREAAGIKTVYVGNEIDNPNSYMFKHNPREEGRDFIDEISELEGDEILVSRSTITSAIHLAAYMGAKNIILCGHDGGEIDGEQYYKGYVKEDWKSASNWSGLKDFLVKAEQETMILKEVLKNQGIVVCSLNPFINLRLEGNKFDTYTISEYKV